MAHDNADPEERVLVDPELGRKARVALIFLGLILIPLAFPVGFIAMVFSGGGHGSPFDGGPAEFIFGLAMLGIPAVMIALGIACLSCSNRWLLRVVGALALALPIDLAVALVALRIASEPSEPEFRRAPLPEPQVQLGRSVIVRGTGRSVSMLCDAENDKCVETGISNGFPTPATRVSDSGGASAAHRRGIVSAAGPPPRQR